VVWKNQIMSALSAQTVGVVVIAPAEWMAEYDFNLSPDEIKSFQGSLKANYSLVNEIEDIQVYRRRSTL